MLWETQALFEDSAAGKLTPLPSEHIESLSNSGPKPLDLLCVP